MPTTKYMHRDIVRGYKIKIHPTEPQQMRINQLIRLSRSAYNWAIETVRNRYKETNQFTGFYTFMSLVTELYKKDPETDETVPKWITDLPSSIARQSVRLAIRSYEMFFRKVNKWPRFKSRKRSAQSYHFRGERLYLHDDYIVVEGLGKGFKARIPCDTSFIPKGENIRYYTCVISRDYDGYYLSLNVGYKKPFITEREDGEVIGIDLGVRKRAVLSDGTVYKGPNTEKLNKRCAQKSIRCGRDRRRRLEISQRTSTKYVDIPKTKNEVKREFKYQSLRRKIANVNKTYNHTMTREIVNRLPKAIVLENLSVRDLIRDSKNRYVTRKIAESDFYTIRQMLIYKAEEYDIPVIIADRFYPSTQICSKCGARHKLGSSEIYVCDVCGNIMDRDLNAAINLKNLVK